MKSRLLAVLTVLAFQGCSTPPPTAQQLASADYGPFPHQFQVKLATYLQATLKDPDTAKLSAPIGPARTYAGLSAPVYGWGVCMGVNAKNSFGGYTGPKQYFFLFRNGEIAMVERAEGPSSFETEYVQKLCKRLI